MRQKTEIHVSETEAVGVHAILDLWNMPISFTENYLFAHAALLLSLPMGTQDSSSSSDALTWPNTKKVWSEIN